MPRSPNRIRQRTSIPQIGGSNPPRVPSPDAIGHHEITDVCYRPHLLWACRLISRTRDFESRGGGAEPPRPSTFGSVAKQKSTPFIRERFGGANPPRATSFGSIAQLAERLAHNQGVAGSRPAGPTSFKAISSVGRAPLLQIGGHPFEPDIAYQASCGYSSDGRARSFQVRCRRFETGYPLHSMPR